MLSERIAGADEAARPAGWRLSPRAVRSFIVGDAKLGVKRKFYGDDALADRCIVTLMSNRGLLLAGQIREIDLILFGGRICLRDGVDLANILQTCLAKCLG